jgi:hypothetical protein
MENSMQINIELNEEYESKLAYVRQKTDQKDVKALIEGAIDTYYNQLKSPKKTALEIFTESGLISSIEAEPDLSTNYKSAVHSIIQERIDRSQEP